MAKLPSGTVTFLFTDMEGSTRLLARLRGGYADVVGEHQRVLRAAFEERKPVERRREGALDVAVAAWTVTVGTCAVRAKAGPDDDAFR